MLMSLPKVFVSEAISKPPEQSLSGGEVSKPEQIQLPTEDSQVAKSRLFQEETHNSHKSLAGLKINERPEYNPTCRQETVVPSREQKSPFDNGDTRLGFR
ncbi:hypothetical protein llap_9 [Limosa lapponica baueri]|uniref:Uncharacterized protein n=1 Tax=Limosa lapponica baueri TaxID=1758121 RepID=A0A2I0UU85_LIMLA|nr:hypothetical protein llap_9 [Limosa lapponica baueri]